MTKQNWLDTLTLLLIISGFIPYIRLILKGIAKPSKASWLIWGSLDSLILAGMIASRAVNAQIIGAVLGAWITVILAFRFGVSGWTPRDKWALAGGGVGILLWLALSNPTLAIGIGCAVVLWGAWPTFDAAYKNPQNESRAAWTLFWLSCLPALYTVPKWDFDNTAQPITFLIVETVMLFLVWWPRNNHLKATPALGGHTAWGEVSNLPLTSKAIRALTTTLLACIYTEPDIQMVGSGITGYTIEGKPKMHGWFCLIGFKLKHGAMLITIPYPDWGPPPVSFEKPLAVYMQGNGSDEEVAIILEQFHQAALKQLKKISTLEIGANQ